MAKKKNSQQNPNYGATASTNMGEPPQNVNDDLEKNNRTCWWKCTHKENWICGYSVRTGVFFVGCLQFVICLSTVAAIVKDKDDSKPFPIGNAVVSGLIAICFLAGAKFNNEFVLKIGRGASVFNIFLAIATLIVIWITYEKDDGDDSCIASENLDCNDWPIASIIMQVLSCLGSIVGMQMVWGYINILRGETVLPTTEKASDKPTEDQA